MEIPHVKKLILYEDEHILVVNKPAGLAVLPDGWEPGAPYLLSLLQAKFPGLLVVHRLDKVTSGVMVFARTAESHRSLNLQFEHHTPQKIYHALCMGVPNWDEHTARHKLRINVGHSHRTVVDNGQGKPAETHFKVLQRWRKYALLQAIPATGRTHQIRVHAYALGFPLLGDSFYSAPSTDLIDRPALHAHALAFIHPASLEPVAFTAPYPEDFKSALGKIRAGQ
ncbi:MAG TPA: RluA family pseudouridine synthase [Anaerolineales bacterium]|jgi:RluA family pseudouridine synthase